MNVKLKRMGTEGSYWVLTRRDHGASQLLDRCDELDEIVPEGLAWCEAEQVEGRWIVRRVIAAALPAPEWRSIAGPQRAKCEFQVVASR